MSYYQKETLMSFNQPGEICGDDKPLFECNTVKQLLRTVVAIGPLDSEMTGWATADTTICDTCAKHVGVAAHIVEGHPTEELCFTFTDPDVVSRRIDMNDIDSKNTPPFRRGIFVMTSKVFRRRLLIAERRAG